MSERHWHHLSKRDRECCVDKILRGNPYKLEIIYSCPKAQLNNAEIYFIHKFESVFPNGWNFTEGGQSSISNTSKQKWKESINKHYLEHPVSDEFKQRMREINLGRKRTSIHNYHNSLAIKAWHSKHPDALKGKNNPMYGVHPSDKCIEMLKSRRGKDSSRSKAILQYSLDGEFISRWDSIADASESVSGNRDSSHISACAKGNRRQAYGYIWKYE